MFHNCNKKAVFLCTISLAAVFAVLALYAARKQQMMPFDNVKSSYFQNLNIVLEQLDRERSITTITGNNHGPFYLIFLGHLGHLLQLNDPAEVSLRFSEFWYCALALAFPLLLWRLIGYDPPSIAAGTLIMLAFAARSQITDHIYIYYSYWSGGCFTMLCCPMLSFLLVRTSQKKFGRLDGILIALVIILMAFENIIRQHFAFPLLVCLLMVFLLHFVLNKNRDRLLSILLAALTCLTFFCAPPAAKTLYDLTVHQVDVQTVERPWHGIWCGLGVFENEYGFAWDDKKASEYVAGVDPTVEYCSEEYFDILRERVLDVAVKDPGWVVQTLFQKFVISIKAAIRFHQKWFILSAVCVGMTGLSLYWRKKRWEVWFWPSVFVGLICMLSGTLQGVVGYPGEMDYILPSIAGCEYVMIACFLQTLAGSWPLLQRAGQKTWRFFFAGEQRIQSTAKSTDGLIKQFLRFGIVGIANTLISVILMFLLYDVLRLGYWGSSAVSYVVGALFSFAANRRFTFRSKDDPVHSFLRFILLVAVCYLCAYGCAKPLIAVILGGMGSALPTAVEEKIAMLGGMVLYTVMNFCGQRLFVFQKEDNTTDANIAQCCKGDERYGD